MMRFESDFDAISGGIMIGCITLGVYINIICVKHINIVHICFHMYKGRSVICRMYPDVLE